MEIIREIFFVDSVDYQVPVVLLRGHHGWLLSGAI